MRQIMDHFPRKHLQMLFLVCCLGGFFCLLLPSPLASAKKTVSSDQQTNQISSSPALEIVSDDPSSSEIIESGEIIPTAEEVEAANSQESGIKWLSKIIRKGDSLSSLFANAGLSASELHDLMGATKDRTMKAFSKIHPGQKVEFSVDDNQRLSQLRYIISPVEILQITKIDNGTYEFEKVFKKYDIQTQHIQVNIQQSLFVDAQNAGLDASIIMKLADIFAWDIDFALDIKAGDSFDVIYEELYLDGKKQKNGKILAANFFNKGTRYSALYYEGADQQQGGYYTDNGESMRKAFTRSPVDFARISSHFNLQRKHPVLHTIRAHKGVDYAAAMGTPIKATGDGKILLASQKGGYGKTIIIKHGDSYSTLYGHLSGYAQGIRPGKNIRQGQVIGYVGSTGMATGPHLHYEFRINGLHRNPLTVKLPRSLPLNSQEKKRFLAETSDLRNQLLAFASQRALALNER